MSAALAAICGTFVPGGDSLPSASALGVPRIVRREIEVGGGSPMELRAGDTAPAFALPDENGKIVSSEGLRGRRYVLYFYPKDDTPGCTTEACQFQENLTTFQSLEVPVLGVSRDDAASHRAFQQKFSLTFPLLSDPDKMIHESYGAWGDRPGRGEGVIRSTFVVDEAGKIKRAWYGVKPDGHASEVLQALER